MISFKEWLQLQELSRMGSPSSADDEERDGIEGVFKADVPMAGTAPGESELPPTKHKCNKTANAAIASMTRRNSLKKK